MTVRVRRGDEAEPLQIRRVVLRSDDHREPVAAHVIIQETHEPRASGHRPWRLLLPLIVLSICGTLMEEVANSWSALFFTQETAAPANLVGLGFTIVLACQFIGRILGDPMTDRWGREAVATFGGILVAIGMATAMLSPSASTRSGR